jgi:nicotinamide-nucleotide amidase
MNGAEHNKMTIQSAEILSVGTELLLGETLDTNGFFLAGQLAELGISTYRHTVVGDNAKRIEKAITDALEHNDLVITTGGLGPTADDLSGVVAAKVAGFRLVSDPLINRRIDDRYALRNQSRHVVCPSIPKDKQNVFVVRSSKSHVVYPLVPEGATLFMNENGTSPGALMMFDWSLSSGESKKKAILLLPGPPNEMEPMFLREVRPVLEKITPERLIHRYVHLTGIGEPDAEAAVRDLVDQQTNPTIAVYVRDGDVSFRITQRLTGCENEEDRTETLIDVIKERLGAYIYEIGTRNLPEVVRDKLLESGATCAFAESCTGGLAASLMARVPGASDVFKGGVVTYTNAMKTDVLGVPDHLLSEEGPVSAACARAMAEGLYHLTGAVYTVSVTGFAGPAGGTIKYPVGTVFIACRSRKGTRVIERHYSGSRANIQDRAAYASIDLLYRSIESL